MNGLNWNQHQDAVDATMAALTEAVEHHRRAGLNFADATHEVACEWGWTLQDVRLHYQPSGEQFARRSHDPIASSEAQDYGDPGDVERGF